MFVSSLQLSHFNSLLFLAGGGGGVVVVDFNWTFLNSVN